MNMKPIRNVVAGTLLAGGAILTAATGFSIATAQTTTATTPATTAPAGPHGFGPGRLYSKLGLSPEQQSQIKAIFTAAKPQMQSLHQQAKANHLKLMQTKPDDPNYGNVAAEVAQSDATLASQRTTQHAALRTQIYAVLTPGQKTQLATLEAQWAANPHHGHWGHRGPGASGAAAAPAAQ
jgi:periplasmic protein CpxP/Spy